MNLNPAKPASKLIQQATIETFTDNINSLEGEQNALTEFKIATPSESFCKSYLGNSKELEHACDRLTKENCDITSCCVRTIDNKCLAGSVNGPTYHNNDSYYYLGNCYGIEC